MAMSSRILTGLFVALTGMSFAILISPLASAQEAEGWSSPVRLSEGIIDANGAPARMLRPSAVADDWGMVHVVWPVQIQEQTAQIGDTLYYARWSSDTGWSDSLDILYLAPDRVIEPRVAVDNLGWVHVVWVGLGHIGYSRAPVMTAPDSMRSWLPEIQIAAERATQAAIAIDSTARIHVAICDGSDEVSVKYTNSSDGFNWTSPESVLSGLNICQVDIAVDDHDQLHLVFGVGEVGGGKAVYYTRSEDNGRTWSPPTEVDHKDARFWQNYAPEAITVLPANDGVVHIVWFGAPAAHRWHQWSQDDGQTWSSAVQLSPDLRLSTSPPGLAIDSLGRLHLISLGGGEAPFGLYHAVWDKGVWSPLVQILDWGDEMADIAIADGNRLHVVWDKKADGDYSIWATSTVVDAPAIAPNPFPTRLQAAPTLSFSETPAASGPAGAAQAETAEVMPTRHALQKTEPAPNQGSPMISILLSALASGLTVVVVLLVRRRPRVH